MDTVGGILKVTDTQKLKQELDKFVERDLAAIDSMGKWLFSSQSHRLNFAEIRLNDVTALLVLMYKYILERENHEQLD
jgi:hypothetical protein